MSLGSKELFHSNFLEFLWDTNGDTFIKMINDFYTNQVLPLQASDYTLGREEKNFDICIYHMEGKKKIYDFVLENKVKSLPYKEQLQDYVDKVGESQDTSQKKCNFLLLTLSDSFPDKSNLTFVDQNKVSSTWLVVKYDDLHKGIQKFFNSQIIKNPVIAQYIKDYGCFIEQLELLMSNHLLSQNISTKTLFKKDDIDKLKKIRLHDLYIKSRSSWFLLTLKDTLIKHGHTPIVVHKYGEINSLYHSTKGIYLNVDMYNATGQIAAWIADGHENTFEIVIQGNQYRHGINQRGILITPKPKDKYAKLNALYSRLNKNFTKADDFLNRFPHFKTKVVQPNEATNYRGTKKIKAGPFNCYEDVCIYRYVDVSDAKISILLEAMIDEIEKIYITTPVLI